jgi:3-oxoacyl-[acyl-carrier protein] reductase
VKAPIDVLGLSNGARSGLTGFVAGLARQTRVASRNVTINNLLPGVFDTDRLRSMAKGTAAKTGQSVDAVRGRARARCRRPAAWAPARSSAPPAPSCAACTPATSPARTS